MQDVLIKNKLLLQTLNEFAETIFATSEEVRENLKYPRFEDNTDCESGCDHDYLNKRLQESAIVAGYPLHVKGIDINTAKSAELPDGWLDAAAKLDKGIMQAIGVGFSALKMYYPDRGYIAWHNNCNCPGQNLLLTYSKTGNGYFEWMDPLTQEIIRMEDRPGWTAKVGYYGSDKEPDKILWHCAKSYEPRLTVSYVVRDQAMWEYMVEDIQSDQ